MADITASMVKELREMTGAGMMDCKKALAETNGNMDEAVEVLRKSGAAKAEKKASRIAAEGITRVAMDGNKAVVVEVNAETDFVAKNEVFQEFVQSVADQALKSGLAGGKSGEDVDKLLGMNGLQETLVEKTATIGEKLSIRRFETIEADMVVSYIHGGGRIGVLVGATGANDDAAKEALTNVAMQVAAMSPEYLSQADISAEELAKMRNITVESTLNNPDTLPKPILVKVINKAIEAGMLGEEDLKAYEAEKNNKFLFNFLSKEAVAAFAQVAVADKALYEADPIFSKAIDGRINKQIKEICLLEQPFVRSDVFEGNVGGYIANVAKALGANIKAVSFVRFAKGEGIEKKEDNFAAEIASMVQ